VHACGASEIVLIRSLALHFKTPSPTPVNTGQNWSFRSYSAQLCSAKGAYAQSHYSFLKNVNTLQCSKPFPSIIISIKGF